MEKEFKKNIFLLKIHSILIKRVTMPIIILYFLLNNLNYSQIGIIAATMAITIVIIEIPTGMFADKFGRKNALLLCSLSGLIAMLFYYFSNGFIGFLIASIFMGGMLAFFSGTRVAMLYDSLLAMKKEKTYKKELGKMHLAANFFNGLVLLMIPLIYSISPKLPFVIGMGFYTASLFFAFLLVEPPIKKHIEEDLSSIHEMKFTKGLFLMSLFYALSLSFIYATSEYYQPLMKIAGLAIPLFGVVYFIKRILTGIGARYSHHLERWFTSYQTFIIVTLSIFFTYLLIFFGFGYLLIIGVLLYGFIEGFSKVIIGDEINKITSTKNRATIISIGSFIRELGIAGLALIYGFSADLFGVQEVFIIGFSLAILILGFNLILLKKRKII